MLQGQVGYGHIMVVAAAITNKSRMSCSSAAEAPLRFFVFYTNTAILSSFFSQQDDMRVCDEIITVVFFNI